MKQMPVKQQPYDNQDTEPVDTIIPLFGLIDKEGNVNIEPIWEAPGGWRDDMPGYEDGFLIGQLNSENYCQRHWNRWRWQIRLRKQVRQYYDRPCIRQHYIEETKIIMTVSHMRKEKEIIAEDDDKLYIPPFFHSESGTAKLIKRIIETPRRKKLGNKNINTGIEYDQAQLDAINSARESKFMVLTGGPGTGKTTATKGIINAFSANGFDGVHTKIFFEGFCSQN